MTEVVPGILEQEWEEIEQKIEIVLPFAKTIHIDLLDGTFAPNSTFMDPLPFKKYANAVFLELHMMVEEPIQYLKPWAEAGFQRFLGHVEKMQDQVAFVAAAQMLGEVGLALDGPTPLEAVTVPYSDLDCLLFYTSDKAGFSGPPFVLDRLEKVKRAREKTEIPIEVDGGINDTTILQARNAGATHFVSTSFLFRSASAYQQYNLLRSLVQNRS